MSQNKISYLALGDSYTIGELVKEESRWPVLLTEKLNQLGEKVKLEKIIATTGWTTDELLAAIKEDKDLGNATNFDLVSLLIGVNNQYRGYPIEQYKKEFEVLLKKAIELAGGSTGSVFVVSIPDYGITPFAEEKGIDNKKVTEELLQYNTIARQIALEHQVKFYDITPLSLKAVNQPKKYLAEDKLHPSATMYTEWVDYLFAGVQQQLNRQ
ncbi:lysophospholipase [Marivirga lumbricoides]|uniref:Lysophospholipase n=2 Tax=Marivirga lumbricoides TaxID=1046115 RepID=A0ABQ1M154_9BACT|nr:lysophospholipase [Marivirga lumbricoides]